MSIDGIGRPPGGGPPGGVGSTTGTAPTGASFEVARPEATTSPDAPSALAQLERGELSLDQYLDARVEEAVAPFADKLAPAELDFLRSSLRVELESDPVLVELVRRATGSAPTSADR